MPLAWTLPARPRPSRCCCLPAAAVLVVGSAQRAQHLYPVVVGVAHVVDLVGR
jgi:hypothetical protein